MFIFGYFDSKSTLPDVIPYLFILRFLVVRDRVGQTGQQFGLGHDLGQACPPYSGSRDPQPVRVLGNDQIDSRKNAILDCLSNS